MIIIADAHISKARGNHHEFFNMLAAIEGTGHDLVFLGDIFELWIALPGYEQDIHTKFIAWCTQQKNSRSIGFLEGNHEYYLASQRARAFTWCSDEAWRQDDAATLFVHGDQINRRDRNYLIFKKLINHGISKFFLRSLPFGPKMAESIKKGLKKTNQKFRVQMPIDEIKFFADEQFAAGADTIFVGHFHQQYCYRSPEFKELYVLPDWLSTQKATLYQKNPRTISTRRWRELL